MNNYPENMTAAELDALEAAERKATVEAAIKQWRKDYGFDDAAWTNMYLGSLVHTKKWLMQCTERQRILLCGFASNAVPIKSLDERSKLGAKIISVFERGYHESKDSSPTWMRPPLTWIQPHTMPTEAWIKSNTWRRSFTWRGFTWGMVTAKKLFQDLPEECQVELRLHWRAEAR